MPNKSGKSDRSETQQLTVVVRIRPLFDNEIHKGATKIAHKIDDKMVVLADPSAGDPVDVLRAKRAQERKYVYDWAFDENSTQEDVYEKTTKNLVENVVDGYNGTVFAYGPTGSGKTYTMVGEDDNPGIMVRALKDLFKEVDKEHKMFEVTMSYLEIYNENIRDLLNTSPGQLELREDANGNHQVSGLSEIDITSSDEVMSLLMRGNKRRTQESTGANKTSSRSHAVLLVQVKKKSPAHNHQQQLRTGRLYMVDLAGSERAANTQNTGKRLVEGAHINKSLLALGNCINALAERNAKYVNFRDSKLTRILKEPLAGNCKTVMVGHISPSHFHFEETRNTLVYADRAKNITTKLKSNVSDVSYHVAQYQAIISELRQEIDVLHRRIRESKSSHSPDHKPKEENKLTDKQMKQLKQQLIESFNTQMDVRRRMMEIDTSILAQSIEFDKLGMVINEWETEKAVTGLDTSEDGRSSEESMPDHVRQAWDDLQFLRNQHQRYLEMREDCEADYVECKEKTHSVTESLSEKASSREQRELLHLLTRVYQLEIEKLEMQASQLTREHELRCRDLMILRYDRQRQLCDEIITKQRLLIDALATGGKAKNANARKELNDLYRIYQQEIQDLNNGRNSDLGQLGIYSNPFRPNSGSLRPLGSSGSMLELHQLDSDKNSNSSPSNYNPLPPIASQGDSVDQDRQLFQRRRRGPFVYNTANRSDSVGDNVGLPPIPNPQGDPPSRTRNFGANSQFSNSSSTSSNSLTGRRSVSMSSSSDYPSHSNSSSNGRSSDSPDQVLNFRKVRTEGNDELRRNRYGILPSLKYRSKHGTSSDSEVLSYQNRIYKNETSDYKKLQFGNKTKVVEEKKTVQWKNNRNLRH